MKGYFISLFLSIAVVAVIAAVFLLIFYIRDKISGRTNKKSGKDDNIGK